MDPSGLARIIEPDHKTFSEGVAWRKQYYDLIRINEYMRDFIKKNCPERLPQFDKWDIYPDPEWKRRDTYAVTTYDSYRSRTVFNRGFFEDRVEQADTFAHEFRHTMKETHDLRRPSDVLARDPEIERDAREWAKQFWRGKCGC